MSPPRYPRPAPCRHHNSPPIPLPRATAGNSGCRTSEKSGRTLGAPGSVAAQGGNTMPGPVRVSLRAAGLLMAAAPLPASSSRADDLGRFLEQAARQTLRQAVAPQNVPRTRNEPFPGSAGATAPATAPAERGHGEPFAVRTADGWSLVA